MRLRYAYVYCAMAASGSLVGCESSSTPVSPLAVAPTVAPTAFTVALSSKTVVIGGVPVTLTASEPNFDVPGDYFTVIIANSGTTACPTNAIALSEIAAYNTGSLTIAGYAPASCTLAISDGKTTTDLTLNVSGTAKASTQMLVGDQNGDEIDAYDAADPTRFTSFTIPANEIAEGVARDPAGDVYVSAIHNLGPGATYALEKYAKGAHGASIPIAGVALSDPIGVGEVALDNEGDVYTVLIGNAEVVEYSPDLTKLIATLSGSATGFSSNLISPDRVTMSGAIAIDASGDIYVGGGRAGLSEFAALSPGPNDAAPLRNLLPTASEPIGAIAIDGSGNVFFDLEFDNVIYEYPPGTGGLKTTLRAPDGAFGLAVSNGSLYVSTSVLPGTHYIEYATRWFSFDLAHPSASPVPFLDPGPDSQEISGS